METNRRLIASVPRAIGELQLWEHIIDEKMEYELVVNGVFIMATYNSLSSELLVRNAAARTELNEGRLLIGGLGLGYSVKEAVLHDDVFREIHIVEMEEKVIEWNLTKLKSLNGHYLKDDKVKVIWGDFVRYVYDTEEKYDIICMDIDNGPMLISNLSNLEAYSVLFYERVYDVLEQKGIFVIWSCNEEAAILEDMERVFDESHEEIVYEFFHGMKIPYYLYFGCKRE